MVVIADDEVNEQNYKDLKEISNLNDKTLREIEGYLNYQFQVSEASKGEHGYFWKRYVPTVNEVTLELIRDAIHYWREDMEWRIDQASREEAGVSNERDISRQA